MRRIGIVGATSLLGRELGSALEERRFPALTPRLLGLAPEGTAKEARSLVEFNQEPGVIEVLGPDTVGDLDTLFLAGDAAETTRAWELAQAGAVPTVDLTGRLGATPGAGLAGLEGVRDGERAQLVVVAHPAAQALALLRDRLEGAGVWQGASATVFEPASERGLAGIQELEQQTVRLLALQSLPQAVFDAQVAFNLRAELGEEAQPGLDQVRERIGRDLRQLGEEAATPVALQVLQAPLFHACVISLYFRYRTEMPEAAIAARLANPWLAVAPAGGSAPDAVGAAGEDAIQLSALRADPAGGWWLFATLDNLRRTAYSAVDAALAGGAGAR